MGKVTLEMIKKLRDQTGIGIQDCKSALEESKGDFEGAIEYLRKKGIMKAKKRLGKDTSNGSICSYVHNGQIGVLVELACETDFVSRNERFKKLCNELCLQVAASSPQYVSKKDVPGKILEKEKEIIESNMKKKGKPKEVLEKIVEGQLRKFYEEFCLLEQVYIRDEKKYVKDLINEAVAAFGERIEVVRFVRIVLGESE